MASSITPKPPKLDIMALAEPPNFAIQCWLIRSSEFMQDIDPYARYPEQQSLFGGLIYNPGCYFDLDN